MAGIKLEAFQGLIPRASPRLLPPMASQVARNTKILNGELRGFRELLFDSDLTGLASSIKRAFRVPGGGIEWLAFDSVDVSISRSPLINDAHDRYYFAGESIGRPSMNTAARIGTGDAPFFLGIPVPVVAPAVVPPAGDDETRAYLYTFVSAYGEEGPPSPPTLATGNIGTWELASMDTSVPDAGQRNVVTKKIYRTVAGNSTTTFFYVDEVPLAQSTYSDAETSADVANNPILESTNWLEPPSDMVGFVVMPNGYLVGWVGKRLLFSEPYRPHAWPAAYELATEFNIVSLGVFGSTLVIGTQSQPYFGQGVSPASFTTQKIDAIEPCMSRRGMVSMTVGVLYPSVNGMVLANSSGVKTVTKELFTKEEWSAYHPENFIAAHLGLQYMAFNSTGFGFLFDPENPTSRFIELDAFSGVEGLETDHYSGNILLLINEQVWEWDPDGVPTDQRVQWRWKSKTYHLPKPMNFGAARLNFETGDQSQQLPILTEYLPYNESLFAGLVDDTVNLYDDVIFQADFEGANGATSYTEESQFTEAGTFGGNAQLSTTSPMFDTSHAEFDGAAFTFIRFPVQPGNVSAWDGTGKYMTCEVAFRIDTLPVSNGEEQGIILVSDDDLPILRVMMIQSGGTDFFRAGFAGSQGLTAATGVVAGTDYFMVIEADNTGGPGNCVERIWLGTVAGGTATLIDTNTGLTARDPTGMTEFIYVGKDNGASDLLDGAVDHARVTVSDTARYGTGSTINIPATYETTSGSSPKALNTINGGVLGGSPAQSIGIGVNPPHAEIRQPLGGSLMYPIQALLFLTASVRLIISVRDKVVFDATVTTERIIRLPTGFKSDIWKIEMNGNTTVYSLQLAETPKGLAEV